MVSVGRGVWGSRYARWNEAKSREGNFVADRGEISTRWETWQSDGKARESARRVGAARPPRSERGSRTIVNLEASPTELVLRNRLRPRQLYLPLRRMQNCAWQTAKPQTLVDGGRQRFSARVCVQYHSLPFSERKTCKYTQRPRATNRTRVFDVASARAHWRSEERRWHGNDTRIARSRHFQLYVRVYRVEQRERVAHRLSIYHLKI